jgi:hypothetical protein
MVKRLIIIGFLGFALSYLLFSQVLENVDAVDVLLRSLIVAIVVVYTEFWGLKYSKNRRKDN